MLILTSRTGETIWIGTDVKITVLRQHGHQVTIGIDALTAAAVVHGHRALKDLAECKVRLMYANAQRIRSRCCSVARVRSAGVPLALWPTYC